MQNAEVRVQFHFLLFVLPQSHSQENLVSASFKDLSSGSVRLPAASSCRTV